MDFSLAAVFMEEAVDTNGQQRDLILKVNSTYIIACCLDATEFL